jgi:phosphoribosylaminoimidazole-succinocarboxamide synthase
MKTQQHMDKDVFRRDLGELAPVYQEVLRRLTSKLEAGKA